MTSANERFARGGDYAVHQFDGLPPRVRRKMLAASPPYRLCDAVLFYEYFIINGEAALLKMMDRLTVRENEIRS